MRILVLGANGMLGNAVYRVLAEGADTHVIGTVRSQRSADRLPKLPRTEILTGVDIDSTDQIVAAVARARPNVIINCIGLIKQLDAVNDPLSAIPVNAILPHRLANIAAAAGGRLVHISTDCVFSGKKGDYRESDQPDAYDLYGRSKLLGEVDRPNAITLRTSIIGHELDGGANGLLGWFLSQSGKVRGYRKAVFSGFPTVVLARLIRDHVLPRPDLHGLYHVSAAAIDKYSLLALIREVYQREIEIEAVDEPVIDRSLNSDRFRKEAGYTPPSWPEMIRSMREFG